MIYLSSSCVKHKKIKDSITELVSHGFRNIELSGGTEYYDELETDLLDFKNKYGLNYLCHNYFPPPKKHFVINLSSLNNNIYEKTLEHLEEGIRLSKKLGAKKFGLHAGFFIDVGTDELGKKISEGRIITREKAIQRFCDGFNRLKSKCGQLKLYIENNVCSSENYYSFDRQNIFMLTTYQDYCELKDRIDFNLLLDVAHLKISSSTLGLNFSNELECMLPCSDYLHISDNDGLRDSNQAIKKDSNLLHFLRASDFRCKDCTLEIYGPMEKLKGSYDLLQETLN